MSAWHAWIFLLYLLGSVAVAYFVGGFIKAGMEPPKNRRRPGKDDVLPPPSPKCARSQPEYAGRR